MAKKLEESPLGWTVVLLFIVLNAAEVLTYDIDDQLQGRFGPGNGFDPQKKYWLKQYYRCMKQARHWLEEMFKIDDIVWESTDKDSRRYTNALADSNEIIRILMLYLDRAHTPGGYEDILHYLRALPEQGLFPSSYIGRFKMDREWVYAKGDRVLTKNHGIGILDLNTNDDNWIINLESGGQTVLNTKQFSII